MEPMTRVRRRGVFERFEDHSHYGMYMPFMGVVLVPKMRIILIRRIDGRK